MGSTSDLIRTQLAPVLVWADEQTAGRGRLGRTWDSPSGGIYFSYKPCGLPIIEQKTLWPLAIGLAAVVALATCTTTPLRLKWPNDIQDDRGFKVGGILVEVVDGELICGIGLNTSDGGSSKWARLNLKQESLWVIQRIVTNIDELLYGRESSAKSIGIEWMKFCAFALGEEMYIVRGGEKICGKFDGIAEDGALRVVESCGKTNCIYSSETELCRSVA